MGQNPKNTKELIRIICCLFCFFTAVPLYADFVWPALYLETRIFTWWAIISGLTAEYIFLRIFFFPQIKKAILADIVMNAFSTLLGVLYIPVAGFLWELFPGSLIHYLFDVVTFNPWTWLGTCCLAVLINARFEYFIIKKLFKLQISENGFFILCIANAISVGLAFISLYIFPVHP